MAKKTKRRHDQSRAKARGGAGAPKSLRAAVAPGRKQAQAVIELRKKSARPPTSLTLMRLRAIRRDPAKTSRL